MPIIHICHAHQGTRQMARMFYRYLHPICCMYCKTGPRCYWIRQLVGEHGTAAGIPVGYVHASTCGQLVMGRIARISHA